MKYWWKSRGRTLRRRLLSPLIFVVAAAVLLVGCAGGATRQESWPGLIADDGTLYAANVDQIQAFDAESGDVLWSWFPGEEPSRNGGFYARPVLDEAHDLLLVAGFDDQTVYALRLGERGDVPGVAWTFPGDGSEDGARGQYVGSGVVTDDLFIIGNGDGSIYAIDLEDGSLAWSFATGDRVWATPLVVGGTVYIASLDHYLYALNLSDGTEQWRLETRGAIAGSPVAVQGTIWFGDFGDQIYEVDPETGDILWIFEEGKDWFWATPVVDEDRLYFADVSGNVFALEAETHDLLWQTHIDDVFRGEGLIFDENLYLPGHQGGRIYNLDVSNGDRIPWGEEPENPRRLPSSLAMDDDLIFAMPILSTERIQAYGIVNGKLQWQYPQAEGE